MCAGSNFMLSTTHVSGTLNSIADYLSRFRMQGFRELSLQARSQLDVATIPEEITYYAACSIASNTRQTYRAIEKATSSSALSIIGHCSHLQTQCYVALLHSLLAPFAPARCMCTWLQYVIGITSWDMRTLCVRLGYTRGC